MLEPEFSILLRLDHDDDCCYPDFAKSPDCKCDYSHSLKHIVVRTMHEAVNREFVQSSNHISHLQESDSSISTLELVSSSIRDL
jgi:hypothetical protein